MDARKECSWTSTSTVTVFILWCAPTRTLRLLGVRLSPGTPVGLGRFSLKLLRITLPHSVTPVGMAAIITYCIVAVGARFFLQIASNNNYRFHFRAVQSRQLAQLLPVAVSITKLLMGLGKTSSVVVACYGRAASAGLALSSRATGTTTHGPAVVRCVVHRPWRDRPEQALWTRIIPKLCVTS